MTCNEKSGHSSGECFVATIKPGMSGAISERAGGGVQVTAN